MGNVSELEAIKKWKMIPDDFRQKLLHNVFCSNCGVTSLASDYNITYEKNVGILLKGKCAKCRNDVCRVIEDI